MLVHIPDARRDEDRVTVGRYNITATGSALWVIGGARFGFDVGEPTAWQPLPEPPQ